MAKNIVSVKLPRREDVMFQGSQYVNITEVARSFNKRVDAWTRLKATKRLIECFKSDPGYTGLEPVVARKGGKEQKIYGIANGEKGTFAHPVIAHEFTKWCDAEANTKPDSVYLISALGSNMVKIGVAKQPFVRMKSMQTGSPLQLAMLRVRRDDDAEYLESRLHQHFAQHHSHGEWFEVKPDLAAKEFDHVVARWTVAKIY